MKKNIPTPLTDKYLQSLENMQQAGTGDFFYTRLKAKMENQEAVWSLPFRPAWALSVLSLFLFLNIFLITQTAWKKESATETSSLQNFATSYHLSLSTPY